MEEDAGASRAGHRLAALAGRQHGIVSIRQLEALGYSRATVSRNARLGRLHRLHRGVYAVGHRSLSWESRCLAAVLACAPNAVASHVSAAWLWGLLPGRPETFHVTAPTRRRSRAALRVHFASLSEEDRALREGIPVTALPRTLLDMASAVPARRLDRAIERSEVRGLFDLRAVDALLRRAGHHPGVGPLRRALTIYRSRPDFTRSGLERRFLELVGRAGLPAPSMNYTEAEYELDAYWQPERFAVELDVYETHGSHAAFERDRLRQEDLKLAGIEITRVTGPRLDREPNEVVRRVAALLRQRRQQLKANVGPRSKSDLE